MTQPTKRFEYKYNREIKIRELDQSYLYDIDHPLGKGSFGSVFVCHEVRC